MTLIDWPESERPRERLLRLGGNALSDAELLAVFLQTGTSKHDAIVLARHCLATFGSVTALLKVSRDRFCAVDGLGPARYAQLQAIVELTRRSLVEVLAERPIFDSPAAVRDYLRLSIGNRSYEVFCALFLDAQHRLIVAEELFRGTLAQTSVQPREGQSKSIGVRAESSRTLPILRRDSSEKPSRDRPAGVQIMRAITGHLSEIAILSRRSYIDTIKVHTKTFPTDEERAVLVNGSASKSVVIRKVKKGMGLGYLTLIQRPTRDLFIELDAKAIRFRIVRVDIALDLMTADFDQASRAATFVMDRLCRARTLDTTYEVCGSVCYIPCLRKNRGDQFVVYYDRRSKITGDPCCHIELRMKGSAHLMRLNLSALTLADLDHRTFWETSLQLLDGLTDETLRTLWTRERRRNAKSAKTRIRAPRSLAECDDRTVEYIRRAARGWANELRVRTKDGRLGPWRQDLSVATARDLFAFLNENPQICGRVRPAMFSQIDIEAFLPPSRRNSSWSLLRIRVRTTGYGP